jgi:hypothetical protein
MARRFQSGQRADVRFRQIGSATAAEITGFARRWHRFNARFGARAR